MKCNSWYVRFSELKCTVKQLHLIKPHILYIHICVSKENSLRRSLSTIWASPLP